MNKREFWDEVCRRRATGEDVEEPWNAFVAGLGVKRDENPIRVLVVPGCGGVSYWRVYPQFCELARDPRFDIRMTSSISAAMCDEADVLFLQRAVSPRLVVEVQRRAVAGKATIVDADDFIHEIPLYNPNRRAVMDQHQPELYDAMAGAATFLTFGQQLQAAYTLAHLEEVYPAREFRWAVLPLCFDPDVWPMPVPNKSPIARRDDGTVTIGWDGAYGTHGLDLAAVAEPLADLMAKHPNVWFVRNMCTDLGRGPLSRLPRERCIETMWDDYMHLIGRYTQLIDIGLAPLALGQQCVLCAGERRVQVAHETWAKCPVCGGGGVINNRFNRSKSDLKLLQYGIAGQIACVATDIEPYRDTPAILVDGNNPEIWYRELERFVTDAEARKANGRAIWDYVHTRRTAEACITPWWDAILSAVEKGS